MYSTCGWPWFTSTLNSRFKRSTKISKCNSPIPEIIVWPEAWSVFTWNVGSSSANLDKPIPNLSTSALVLGSTAIPITGSGNDIDSSTIGFFKSDIVSPVLISLKPTAAPMSPASILLIGSCLFECIW